MRQLSRRAAVGLELLALPAFLFCAGKEFTAELPHSPGTFPSRENKILVLREYSIEFK